MHKWNEQEYKTDTWHNSNIKTSDELSHSGKLMSREKPTGCNDNIHYLIITKRLFKILLLVMIETQLRHGI
jgi:hypothetical protein